MEHGTVDGLEAAALGWCQLRWHLEGVELAQGLLKAGQRGLQGRGPGRERGRWPRWCQRGQRIVEDLTTIGRIRHAVCGHQREGLACGQLVACDGAEHGLLLITGQRGQSLGHGGPDAPLAKRGARLRPQAPAKHHPALHPARLTATQESYGPGRQPVILDQRRDDARLIQGGEGARWGVRGQDDPLVLHFRRHWLNHHWHVAVAR
jgi:hypothetical protein